MEGVSFSGNFGLEVLTPQSKAVETALSTRLVCGRSPLRLRMEPAQCADKSQNITDIFTNAIDIFENTIDISINFNDILSFVCVLGDNLVRWP